MKKRTPYYNGDEFALMSKHDGGLRHVVGASNYQVMRANRTNPSTADDIGNTYNHAPMMTYWRSKFYLQYLSNPVGEHQGAGISLLSRSDNGIDWEKPKISFPAVTVKAGVYNCEGSDPVVVPEEKDCYMHQRMAFFHSSDDRLLVSGFYGHSPHYELCPWVNYGMGRAVREVYEDGTFGEVYFIHYLEKSGFTPELLPFKVYTECTDKGFVKACEELLGDRFVTQQWSEEHGNDDKYVYLKTPAEFETGMAQQAGGEANIPYESASSFCWYHIDERTVVALWKQSRVARSDDGGDSWEFCTEHSFATSGAKSWGQKTEDGRYAIAYDNSLSSEHRYPLVTVVSEDGIEFDDMACVFGEVPPKRYDGTYKDFGPQYIRGICEGHKEYPSNSMWLCHSINKEDIGVTRIPVPIRREVTEHVNDDFSDCADGYITDWNIYSTKWSTVTPYKMFDEINCMRIADSDPCDYARAMRIFKDSKKVSVSLEFMCEAYSEDLFIELCDSAGNVATRVTVGNKAVSVRYGSDSEAAFEYPISIAWHELTIEADCTTNSYEVIFDNQVFEYMGAKRFLQRVNSIERAVIRTKPFRYLPNIELLSEQPDLQDVDNPVGERLYYIRKFTTKEVD